MIKFKQGYLARFMTALNVRTKKDMADVLNIKSAGISFYGRQNKIPAKWLNHALEAYQVSPDWVISGIRPYRLTNGFTLSSSNSSPNRIISNADPLGRLRILFPHINLSSIATCLPAFSKSWSAIRINRPLPELLLLCFYLEHKLNPGWIKFGLSPTFWLNSIPETLSKLHFDTYKTGESA